MGTARELLRARAAVVAAPIGLEVPNVGKMFYRMMTQAQATDFLQRIEKAEGRTSSNAIMAAMAICDEEGKLEYDADKPEDLTELLQLDTPTLGFIAKSIRDGNGLSPAGVEATGNASPIVKSS
jgi:hypothetical protein